MKMLLTALLLTFSLAVSADVLLIEEVRQVDSMELPANGLSKNEVQAAFGEPEQKHEPVGDPPITRWNYGEYSVYFEYDLVLFTVLSAGHEIDKA